MQLQHNSKLKKHLTRALSLMLVFALALSTPLTTHATGGGVGDGAGNNGGGEGGMSGSTSTLAWSQYHQGYRIYVIDKDFIRISPVYDFTYSEPTGIGEACKTTRFDGPNSPSQITRDDISVLQEWCDSPDEVPTPTKLVNGTRIGNGYEFKQWFFNGRAGTSIPGGGSGSGTPQNPNPQNPNPPQDYPNTVLVQKINVDYVTFNSAVSTYTTRTSGMSASELEWSVNNRISLADWYMGVSFSDMASDTENMYYEVFRSDIGKWFDYDGDGDGDYQLTESSLRKYCKYLGYKIFTPLFDQYVDSTPELVVLGQYIYVLGKAEVLRSSMDILDEDFQRINETLISSSKFNTTESPSLLFQSIPLAGEEGGNGGGGGAGMPAYNLINKNNTIIVPGYISPYDALRDGCYIVVEPITWLYVRANNGPWDSPSTYESTRTYGTYWNLASKWVGTGGFYNTIMTKLFNNCLAISRTVTSPTGKTLQGIESTNQKSVADSLNYMNAGYGLSMHISKIHN